MKKLNYKEGNEEKLTARRCVSYSRFMAIPNSYTKRPTFLLFLFFSFLFCFCLFVLFLFCFARRELETEVSRLRNKVETLEAK